MLKSLDSQQPKWSRVIILLVMIAVTVSFHYRGMGHSDTVLSGLFRMFCYVPILLASLWFGLRGGLLAAAAIILVVAPNMLRVHMTSTGVVREILEYFYYFLFGGIFGYLVDREREAQRKREELTRQMTRMEHLSAIGEMAAGLAHEIKNPMGSIKGAAEIIEPEITPDHPKREFVNILLEEVNRLNNVIENFLQFARPLEIKLEDIPLTEALDSVVRQLDIGNKAPGITVELEAPDDFVVTGDKERLRQVFLNLGLNAIEAMGESGTLEISAYHDKPKKEVCIEFRDTGPGIPEDQRRRIFMPFHTDKPGGTGLGLTISERIVVAHGGRIEVSNSPDGGAVFGIVLPMSTGAK